MWVKIVNVIKTQSAKFYPDLTIRVEIAAVVDKNLIVKRTDLSDQLAEESTSKAGLTKQIDYLSKPELELLYWRRRAALNNSLQITGNATINAATIKTTIASWISSISTIMWRLRSRLDGPKP